MRKYVIACLLLVLVLSVFVSCGDSKEEAQEILLEKTFSNDFFSIDYPVGYSPMRIGDTNPGVILSSKDSKMVIEAYANWNDNCRNGDTYRLWQNGEDFWDELTEVRLGDEKALFSYTEQKYTWPFMSVTIPKNGWELIATVVEFDKKSYDLAKSILMSTRLTDPGFEIPFDGVVFAEYDLSREPEFSETVHKLGPISMRSDCEFKSKSDKIAKLKCDDYQIDVLFVIDWKSISYDLKHVARFQDWEGVDLGSQRVMEMEINDLRTFWSESLREEKKTISVTIPFDGGYVIATASGMTDDASIKKAADCLLSIEPLDNLHFGTK